MKNLLSLTSLDKAQINHILEIAGQMRRIVLSSFKKGPQLAGKVVAGVWNKPCASSTGVYLATAYLSGTALPVFGAEEPLEHCQLFDDMGVNTVVVSCENDNLAKSFAAKARCSVVNGGSGRYDPIGVLADLLALSVKADGLGNLSVLAVGNRDANKVDELIHCLQLFNSTLVWYLPADDFVTRRRGIVLDNAVAAFSGVDAVVDLGLSAYSDPVKYYGTAGGILQDYLERARLNCPLLGSRKVVDNIGVKDYEYSIAAERETCYVAVAMAVLYLLND